MKKIILTSLLGLGLISFAATASATLIFNLGGCDYTDDPFGTGSCRGSGADIAYNSMTMTFAQNGTDTVRMTLDTSNMAPGLGKITSVWFNVNGFDFADLSFASYSGVETKKIIEGGNVGNMGQFAISFSYVTSGPLGAFKYGMQSSYDITADGLTENSFAALNSEGFAGVFHLGVITGNGENGHSAGGVPVPASPSMLLFGTGLAGLAGVSRKRKKK
ncbi:MAG: VPLPA-CTERM sorting domain-containing protein [Desulfobulbaceae bacterium]|nr:VPLPA-CTERM sorting domain-containing protein [Desulfobulbaceae bacterium]